MRMATWIGIVLIGLAARDVLAEPVLQVYAEGSTYDPASESWVGPLTSDPIRLWAIGFTDGGKARGTIYDVHLIVAFVSAGGPVTIAITPSTTGGLGGFADPSTPSAPILLRTITDGSLPVMADGSDLPRHGEYGPGIFWMEFDLGTFTLMDSPIGDFIDTFPSPGRANAAQIDVYEITITGALSAHFDLTGGVRNSPLQGVFAPFSHDAQTNGGEPVPEPASIVLVGLFGVAAIAGRRRMRRPA